MKLSEAAAIVITLAQVIRAYWDTELPKRHPDYPIIGVDEDLGPPPPEEAKLKEFLASLPPEMLHQLLLIMYLGRGDFGTTDLAAQYEYLKSTFRNTDLAILQMMSKAPLARYIASGLEKLKRSKINPDKLFATVSRTRK